MISKRYICWKPTKIETYPLYGACFHLRQGRLYIETCQAWDSDLKLGVHRRIFFRYIWLLIQLLSLLFLLNRRAVLSASASRDLVFMNKQCL